MAAIFIAGEINLVGAEGARVPPKLSGKCTALISHLERHTSKLSGTKTEGDIV